jgi:hydroxyethylthiazole kinase-like uncharacterized protein yjeF
VAVVCGKGNNGGDGFVLARQMAGRGAAVAVWLVGRSADVRGDAATNLAAVRQSGLPFTELGGGGIEALRAALREVDLVVDALLGTGVSGPATGPVAEAIAAVNEAGRPVCALDLPSGLSADHGRLPGPVVRAALTVTFGVRKLGLALYPGAEYAGQVRWSTSAARGWLEEGLTVAIPEAEDLAASCRRVSRRPQGSLRPPPRRGGLGRQDRRRGPRVPGRAPGGHRTGHVRPAGHPAAGRRGAACAEAHDRAAPETGADAVGQGPERLGELVSRVDAVAPGRAWAPAETQAAVRELAVAWRDPWSMTPTG